MNQESSKEPQGLLVDNASGLHPRGRAVLVKPYEPEKLGTGLIELPDSVKQSQHLVNQRAVVIEVGPAAWQDEPQKRASPGEKVLFTRYAGFMAAGDVTKDGQIYRLVNDNDIFCVIEE